MHSKEFHSYNYSRNETHNTQPHFSAQHRCSPGRPGFLPLARLHYYFNSLFSAVHSPTPNRTTKMSDCYFPDVPGKIEYLGPESNDPLSFNYYNAEEVILGRPMKEWLRFSVCYWHSFQGKGADPFGLPTISRHFDDGTNSLENAKRRADAAFEFFTKLGVEFYTFHDRDVAPERGSLKETNDVLDEMTSHLKALQEKTGVKLLWATQNLFSHPRYMNGAFTNPDAHVFAYAAAQVKKVMDINHKLGGENLVFWGGREGYFCLQ